MKYTFTAYLAVMLGFAALIPSVVNAQEDDLKEKDLQAEQNQPHSNTSEWISQVVYDQQEYNAEEYSADLEDSQNYLEHNSTDWIQDPHRIVGGHPINIQQAPWQVVVYRDNKFVCGGSVISVKWVLTAGHCIANGKYAVRAGSRNRTSGGFRRSIRLIVVHGEYNPETLKNDIAMMLVGRLFKVGPTVRPIPLAKPSMKLPAKYVVSGWGRLKSDGFVPKGLRQVTVRAVSKSVCKAKYKGKVTVFPKQLCAAAPGKDSCQGDSGGPLVSSGKLFGVVSSGIGCADGRYPGMYTDVRKYNGWIGRVALQFSLL